METLKKMLDAIEIIVNMQNYSDENKIKAIKLVFDKYSKLWKQ